MSTTKCTEKFKDLKILNQLIEDDNQAASQFKAE